MANNGNGQTTNCGHPRAHTQHFFTTEPTPEVFESNFCDGALWTPETGYFVIG